MSFQDHVARGDAASALRSAAVYGSLWAIGAAWSSAIREITRAVFPGEGMDAAFAEAVAAGISTVFGLAIAFAAAWPCPTRAPVAATLAPPHLAHLPRRTHRTLHTLHTHRLARLRGAGALGLGAVTRP